MLHNGVFCVSLDFELHWGVFNKKDADSCRSYFLQARKSVESLLNYFAKNGIHCTWATVGALAAPNRQELSKIFEKIAPQYEDGSLRPQLVKVGANEEEDPCHFAASLIAQISTTSHQELGTHTYSHFYALEPGSQLGAFERDLGMASTALSAFGQEIKSLVFPGNQYSEQHLALCSRVGIKIVRTNPCVWFWKTEAESSESVFKKVVRTLDHYFPLGKSTSFPAHQISKQGESPYLLPASRFFRPSSALDTLLPGFKIKRIKKEMTRAAQNAEVYHLWWHPHNFSVNPQVAFCELRELIEHFSELRKKYHFQSMNMGELAAFKEQPDAQG